MRDSIKASFIIGDDTQRIRAQWTGILSERIACLKLALAKAVDFPTADIERLRTKLVALEALLVEARNK